MPFFTGSNGARYFVRLNGRNAGSSQPSVVCEWVVTLGVVAVLRELLFGEPLVRW